MELVYFSSKHDGRCKKRIVNSITRALPDLKVKEFANIGNLHNWLQIPSGRFFAAILEPHDTTTLLELVKLKEYLGNSKVILHLPNDSRQSFSYSSKLTPRCVLAAGDGKEAIISVLSKWLRAEEKKVALIQ